MRIDEPQNNTNSFANIVIQESNGVQEIFTFRYFPTASKTTSKTESFNGTYTMTKGMCLPDQNGSCDGDSDDDGGSDGGTDFVEICENSFEITSVECQCSHGPGNYCTGCWGPGTYHDIIEATENCYWDYQGSTGTSVVTETSNNTVGGSNTSTGNTNVITTPIKEPLLNYALESIIECLEPDKVQLNWLNKEMTNNSLNILSIFNFISISSCNNETKNLIDELIEAEVNNIEIIELFSELNNFKNFIEEPNFDALNNPWLRALREYAKKLEDLKDKISEPLWKAMNQWLDMLLRTALTKTAFKFNPNADTTDESQKLSEFLNNGERGVGVLLYEFANGEGPDLREFRNGDFWNKFFEGERVDKIKADFKKILLEQNLTFNQFVTNNNMLPSSYKFSPDHTTVIDSFEEHKNANWVQFFVGGSAMEYRPSNQKGYLEVKLINPTGRNSLLLHIGDDYDRNVYGNIPLSTIRQHIYIYKLKYNKYEKNCFYNFFVYLTKWLQIFSRR